MKKALGFALVTLASLSLSTAYADNFPSKPITVIVGYGAGGGTDAVVRALTEPLGKILDATILVQNVSGAGGGVAASRVARSDADGYTLLATTSSTFSLEPQATKTAYKNDDFQHIATIAQFQGAMFAKADKPYQTLPQLVDLAKKENRPIKYASFFLVDKLVMNYIGKIEGVEMIPVPVKGGNGAVQTALSGDVDIAYSGGSWAPHVESGAAKVLFATSYDRLKLAPNLVSMKDLGYPLGTTSYLTLSAPKGTPKAVVDKLAAAVEQAMAAELVQKAASSRYMDGTFYGPAQTTVILQIESDSFATMLKNQ
jgi:tripartite-type tricarboxylate transporter receptor subunit TctC